MRLLGVVITKDEELHISRCVKSLKKYVDNILVVDSFSNDQTPDIAKKLGAKVIQRRWVSYSDQLNWLLKNHTEGYDYVFRLDADEYVNDDNPAAFRNKLQELLQKKVLAISIKRSYKFLGSILKDSQLYKRNVVRVFTPEHRFTNRLMDEKLIFNDYEHCNMDLEIIDENLNGVSSWLLKHVNYSNLEAVNYISGGPMSRSQRIYYMLPAFTRAVLYFFVRLIITQKFRGGISATLYTIGQALVYRIMVDYQISESQRLSPQELRICEDNTLGCIIYWATDICRDSSVDLSVNKKIISNLNSFGDKKSFSKFYYYFPIKTRIFINLLMLVPSAGFSFFLIKKYKKIVLSSLLLYLVIDIIIFSNKVQIDTRTI